MEVFIIIVVILIAVGVFSGLARGMAGSVRNERNEYDALKLSLKLFDELIPSESAVESLKGLLSKFPRNNPSRGYFAAVLKLSEATRKFSVCTAHADCVALAQEAANAAESVQKQSDIAMNRAWDLMHRVYSHERLNQESRYPLAVQYTNKMHGAEFFWLERERNARTDQWDKYAHRFREKAYVNAVAQVQATLKELAYYDGPINGELEVVTGDAIANYQRDHGLPATYQIDEPTLAALGMAFAENWSETLREVLGNHRGQSQQSGI